ncbi:hypothetical protein RJ639_039779 [Escallonia herrerae]|uniref:Zinc finger, GRF-type n=1 Tax=Escallonia herrerae TaxID=1293975 RepID=A0AA88WN75_9ASTE|nr:hypothetical protein RJ639_039779 [Escallonia herrerae]
MACGAENEDPCEYFFWIDPPMCERAVQVIPGLLRRINGNAEEVLKAYGRPRSQKDTAVLLSSDPVMEKEQAALTEKSAYYYSKQKV